MPDDAFCEFWTEHVDRTKRCVHPNMVPARLGRFRLVWDDQQEHGLEVKGYHNYTKNDLSLMAKCDIPDCGQIPRMVIVRGPWERFVSGFTDKLYADVGGSCAGDEECFRGRFMPGFYDSKKKEDPFVKFIEAYLKTPDDQLNTHFLPQTSQCLRHDHRWTAAADLSDAEGLDRISLAMNGGSHQTKMSAVMAGKYDRKSTAWKATWCWEGCRKHAGLIEKVRERLQPDVDAIKALGLGDYGKSFDEAAEACRAKDTLCHGPPEHAEEHYRVSKEHHSLQAASV
jgi:hypothetical protein